MANSFIIPCIILITGASGSGKTTVLQHISQFLAQDSVKIFYFDDIGVPSFEKMIQEHGSPERWQRKMTEKWIEKLSSIRDTNILFLEGSFNPDFAIAALNKYDIKNYRLFCLYSDRAIREQRLQYQRLQPELVTDDMENFARFLKQKTIELGGIVVENNDDSKQAASQIVKSLNL